MLVIKLEFSDERKLFKIFSLYNIVDHLTGFHRSHHVSKWKSDEAWVELFFVIFILLELTSIAVGGVRASELQSMSRENGRAS